MCKVAKSQQRQVRETSVSVLEIPQLSFSNLQSRFGVPMTGKMTKTDNTEASEEFEVLPAAKTLDLPLGIRCMEVNVQEVDDAVRQFTKKAVDITSPSWKFPHVTLEKLDVTHVMNVFREHKTLSDNQLYMELMELLIDRLYYAIMMSYEFVNGLEAAFFNAGFEMETLLAKKEPGKKHDWDPLEIAKKALEDKTPKPFHTANIGMLVRQFCMKMMGLENIVLNNVHSFKKSKSGVNNDDVAFTRGSRDAYYLPLRHSETQTEEGLEEGCDSCFIAQNILKCVADEIHDSLKTFNECDSEISKARLELRKDAFSITQRGALLRWLEALGADCGNISKYANMLLDINVKSQETVRTLKEDLEIKEERHAKELTALKEALAATQEELKKEQEIRAKVSKLKDASVIKLAELEKNYEQKSKDSEKLQRECEALQRSFNIAEELNLQIKGNLARCSTDLEKCKKDLEVETKQRETLSKQVWCLSEELAKAGQQLLKLNEMTEMALEYEQENKRLTQEATKLRRIVEKYEAQDGEMKRSLDEKDSRIGYLAGELKNAHSKIEVLTLYPDLNGPLNTPMKAPAGGSSCIETMEMQVKSNQIRIEILRAQSERLITTVSKLRTHMKNKSKTELAVQSKGSSSKLSLASSGSS